MVTKKEKNLPTVIGFIAGIIIGYIIAEDKDVKPEDRWKYIFGGAVFGAFGGLLIGSFFGSKNNTVNYRLYNGKKIVYHGITYSDRIEARKFEHVNSGKLFTRMTVDSSKPRIDALSLERKLIQRDCPLYNIQHNRI